MWHGSAVVSTCASRQEGYEYFCVSTGCWGPHIDFGLEAVLVNIERNVLWERLVTLFKQFHYLLWGFDPPALWALIGGAADAIRYGLGLHRKKRISTDKLAHIDNAFLLVLDVTSQCNKSNKKPCKSFILN